MKNRREVIVWFSALAVAGCSELPKVPVAVSVELPQEVSEIIADAKAIVDQGKKLIHDPKVVGLVTEVENSVSALKSGKGGSVKSVVASLTLALGAIGMLLPPPYNVAAGVLVAVAKAYVGQKISGRLAMSPEMARRVLAN